MMQMSGRNMIRREKMLYSPLACHRPISDQFLSRGSSKVTNHGDRFWYLPRR